MQNKEEFKRATKGMDETPIENNNERTALKMADRLPPKTQPPKSIPRLKSQIFREVSFCFPVADAILSGKLIEILKNQVKDNGGQLFEVGLRWPTPTHYYVVSNKVNLVKLTKMLTELNGMLLEYTYIKQCLSAKSLLPTDKFLIRVPGSATIKNCLRREFLSVQSDLIARQDIDNMETHTGREQEEQNKRSRQPSAERELNNQDNCTKKIQRKNSAECLKVKSIFGETENSGSEAFDIQTFDNSTFEHSERRSQKYWDDKRGEYVCQKKTLTFSQPLNEFICEELTRLQKIYQVEKDKGRACAYRKAIAAIKTLNYEIKEQRDVMHIKGIGPRIMGKIMELIETGKMHKLEGYRKDQKYQALDDLCAVWGIGPTTATQLYNQGIKSLDDLKKNDHLLTRNQKMGLKYVEQFRKKIPRDQVSAILQVVKETIYELVGSRDLHEIEACGSYRRNKDFCGDIDIIITRRDGVFEKQLIFSLTSQLKGIGLITDHLTIPKVHDQPDSYSYMGVCQYNEGYHRRIDIKYYPFDQYAYAILYFTGSDYFNRSMRLFAKKKGYSLSDHSLTPIIKGSGQKQNKQSKQSRNIVCYTEKDVFDYLGLDYMHPEDRNV